MSGLWRPITPTIVSIEVGHYENNGSNSASMRINLNPTSGNNTHSSRPSLYVELDSAYAVGGTEYYTLKDAVEHASDGGTITVLRDVTEKFAIEINKNVTINLQGYTIDKKSTSLTVGTGATVTITGSTGSKLTTGTANVHTIDNQGTLTIEGNITIEHKGTSTVYNAIQNSRSGAVLNVKSGTITSTTSGIYNYNSYTVTNIGDSTQPMNTAIPVIIGETYGAYLNNGTINFYSGIIKGKTASCNSTITPRTGYGIVTDTEDIDGTTYQTAFLSDSIYSITDGGNTTFYITLADAVSAATDGQTITVLANVLDAMGASINKNVTLDMQNFTIKMNYNI